MYLIPWTGGVHLWSSLNYVIFCVMPVQIQSTRWQPQSLVVLIFLILVNTKLTQFIAIPMPKFCLMVNQSGHTQQIISIMNESPKNLGKPIWSNPRGNKSILWITTSRAFQNGFIHIRTASWRKGFFFCKKKPRSGVATFVNPWKHERGSTWCEALERKSHWVQPFLLKTFSGRKNAPKKCRNPIKINEKWILGGFLECPQIKIKK